MKTKSHFLLVASFASAFIVAGLSSCVDGAVQHREAPLPVSDPEVRTGADQTAAWGSQDAQAAGDWRAKQQADAEHEKFIKSLDALQPDPKQP
jgi:hypothetical protein